MKLDRVTLAILRRIKAAHGDNISQKELARAGRVSLPTTLRRVEYLQNAGLIEHERYTRFYDITPAGIATLEEFDG